MFEKLAREQTMNKGGECHVQKNIIVITISIIISKNTPLSFLAPPAFTELGELVGCVGFGGKSTFLSTF